MKPLISMMTWLLLSSPLFATSLPLSQIVLPPGFSIQIYAQNIPSARQMTLGKNGVVYVGTRSTAGKVYAVLPNKQLTHAKEVITIAKGLFMPNGVAYRNGDLFVAEVRRVLRFPNIDQHLQNPPKPIVVNGSFPGKILHGWKYIAFSPDGWLYVPVGAPCNVCIRKDMRFATIMRMKPDGSQLQLYAQGVRNTVGFDWDPQTQELWFTDNGRDWLGDNLPPDELNHAPLPGMHFGFPYVYGNNQPDPSYGHLQNNQLFTPPAMALGPHVAALGMKFYSGSMFPEKYHQQIFIAEHGSWNRTKKIGYRVTLVTLKNHKPQSYQVFAKGWLQGEKAWGRPVDVLVMPDGALLVSDDQNGVIYRISY